MIDLFKSKRAASVLGLALDGNRLEAVVLRRSNGTVQVRQSGSAPLALSPLTDDPELVGREIRNHLDAAGIQRTALRGLPAAGLAADACKPKSPELPEADRAGFLQLEAERGFHSGPEALFIAHSLFKPARRGSITPRFWPCRATISTPWSACLRAAKLKPVTFGLGSTALQPAAGDTAARHHPGRFGPMALTFRSAAAAASLPSAPSTAPSRPQGAQRGFPPI